MKKCAVLFSGGKDSCYAAYLAKQKGQEIACLISVFSKNPYSYMFHTPNIKLVKSQAKVMNLSLVTKKTAGIKEQELDDLTDIIKQVKDKYHIDTIITGALHSEYQSSRIQKICDKLGLKCFNPLWHKDEIEYWRELFENNFEVMITGVAAYGLNENWLGKIIDKENLKKLKELKNKFRFHLAFDGGEAETFVTNCPLFNKKIKVIKGDKIWDGNSGRYDIKKIGLFRK